MSRTNPPHQPTCFPCFGSPEVKALNGRMRELAMEMKEDVDESLDGFLSTSKFPEVIFQRLKEFRELYDRFLQEIITRMNMSVTCRNGCPVCCHVVPCGLEPLEVIDIYNHVRQWTDFKHILRHSARAVHAFQQILKEVQPKENQGSNVYSQALADYYLLRIPCIFLDQECGTCRIYDIRPLICRAVFCLSDPAFCDPQHPGFSNRNLEIIEPVDEINLVLIQTHSLISEAMGYRFPDILQHGLLAWHRWVQERRGDF